MKKPEDIAFGLRVRELRRKRGWTQKELVAKSGVPLSTLLHVEEGYHRPTLRTLVVLADCLDVSLDAFMKPAKRTEPVGMGAPTDE